jgi:hypothetical protein
MSMMPETRPGDASAPQAPKSINVLRADHEALEGLARTLMDTVALGERDGVAAAIAELQGRVAAHLDAEERTLFLRYAEDAPEDASELLGEHVQIRKVLAELDVSVDLHLVRANAIEAFLRKLQAHAAREDASLYRWAAKHEAT